MKNRLVVGLLFFILLLAGCGGSGDDGSTAETQASPAPEEKPAAAPPEVADPGDWAGLKRVAGRYSDRLLIPEGPIPKRAVIRDLKIGEGPVIQAGDDFIARYVSFLYANGFAVEPYWGQPDPYTWGLGGQVEAWEVGLKGMRIGGIREFIVPESLAYDQGGRVYVVQPLRMQ